MLFRLYQCRLHQRSHPRPRRLVLQKKTNDGLILWGRPRPRRHAAILSLGLFEQRFYRHTQKLETLQSLDSCSQVMNRATCGPLGHVLQQP